MLFDDAIDHLGCRIFAIPPRSPDINPIKNMLHLVRKRLEDDALRNKITKENFAAFSERIKRTMENVPFEIISKTILSMNKRIQLIVNGKGNSTSITSLLIGCYFFIKNITSQYSV